MEGACPRFVLQKNSSSHFRPIELGTSYRILFTRYTYTSPETLFSLKLYNYPSTTRQRYNPLEIEFESGLVTIVHHREEAGKDYSSK